MFQQKSPNTEKEFSRSDASRDSSLRPTGISANKGITLNFSQKAVLSLDLSYSGVTKFLTALSLVISKFRLLGMLFSFF
jgi:hypothetical protein